MYKHYSQICLMFFIILKSLLISNNVYAQSVKIVIDPNVTKIYIGSSPQEIWVIAQPGEEGLQFTWKLDGPGEFKDVGSAGIYKAPSAIPDSSSEVTISVTVTDSKGEQASGSVTLTLEVPPTPTPGEYPPVPSDIERLLNQGNANMKRLRLTTPKEDNAFDNYQTVLRFDPLNQHAREKVWEITRMYKTWGDNAYRQKNYDKAKTNYQKYLTVAQYILQDLGDQRIASEIQQVRESLKNMDVYIVDLTPKPPATSPLPQTPVPGLIHQIHQLLEEANHYFTEQYFTEPLDKNAFELYKRVLELDPSNHQALDRIYDMALMSKNWADQDYSQQNYSKAVRYYRQYLTIADYILYTLHDRSIEQEYQGVRRRLENSENRSSQPTP